MDSHSVVAYGGHKNNSNMKRPKTYKGPDLISNLPDFIIGQILSFLHTKDAVRTSVLSKRWMYLWTFITKLSFEDLDSDSFDFQPSINNTHFLQFVTRVLLHLNNSRIESFTLVLSITYDASPINDWISVVLRRGVKKFWLDSDEDLALPSYSLLEFQSVEELALLMNHFAIRVPNYVCLSSLTVLKLTGITITPDSFNNSENLCLKFPVLRKYVASDCSWSSFKIVTLEVPLLEVLSIVRAREEFWSNGSHTVMKFCASHLTNFSYNGYMLPDTVLDLSTTKVDNVNINLCKFEEQSLQEVGILTSKMLKQFNRNVDCLDFQMATVYGLAKDSFADLPAFEMLSRLELRLVSIEILLCLLLKTPVLKTLVIKELHKFDNLPLNSTIVPNCFLSNLQVVEFGMFSGYELQMSLVKFMMENAKVLERMILYHNCTQGDSEFEGVKEKVFSFKKASTFAVIEFSLYKFYWYP